MENEEIEKVLKYNKKNITSIVTMVFFICTIIFVLCTPITNSSSLILAFAFGFETIFLWCFLLPKKIRSKKVIAKYGVDELKKELLSKETIKLIGKDIYLTPKYIISNNGAYGIQVTNYTDIEWIYPIRLGGIRGGYSLKAHLKNGKTIVPAIPKDIIRVKIIFNRIKKDNKEVMLGYTKENIDKYKKINAKYKNKNLYTNIIIIILTILGIIIVRNL